MTEKDIHHTLLIPNEACCLFIEQIIKQLQPSLLSQNIKVRLICPKFEQKQIEQQQKDQLEQFEQFKTYANELKTKLLDEWYACRATFVNNGQEINFEQASEFLEKTLKYKVQEQKINKYVENINRLEKFPINFFEKIKPLLEPKTEIYQIVDKLLVFYKKSMMNVNENIDKKIETCVCFSNSGPYYEHRNLTFGLLFNENVLASAYILKPQRFALENYVFDPINLFFIMEQQQQKSTFFNQIKEHLFATCFLSPKTMNSILKVMQNYILKGQVHEIEDLSSANGTTIVEWRNFKISLDYNSHILNSEVLMKTIQKLLCNKNFCKHENGDICLLNDMEINTRNVLEYLIKKNFSFLIPEELNCELFKLFKQ